MAQVHGWLRRPTAPQIGVPPLVKVPRCLDGYLVSRWTPQVPFDEIDGLPVWKPETLLVFMGARPASFPWSDIAEWLWEACDSLERDLLLAELDGRPRAVWMKTAYIVEAGNRADLSDVLIEEAPDNTKGPYLFGLRNRRHGPFKRDPVWSAKHEVVDYVFPVWWLEKWK